MREPDYKEEPPVERVGLFVLIGAIALICLFARCTARVEVHVDSVPNTASTR